MTRLSSQYCHPLLDLTNAVSVKIVSQSVRHGAALGLPLTMPRAERAHVIADAVQVILEWRNLCPRVIEILVPGRLPPRDVAREIEAVDGKDDGRFRLVPEHAILCGEPLELDEENRRQSGDRERLGRAPWDLAPWAVPIVGSVTRHLI